MTDKVSNERAVAAFAELLPLRNAQSEAVAVKALEWEENGPIVTPSDKYSFLAECQTLVGRYRIGYAGDGWRTRFNGGIVAIALRTVDAAKAAAQADYEQRIRSALTHPAPPLAVTDEMVEMGAVAIDRLWSAGGGVRGYPFPQTEQSYQDHCRSTARAALTAALEAK